MTISAKVIADSLMTRQLDPFRLKDHEIARFWDSVIFASSAECWMWDGPLISNGYGNFKAGKQSISVHRLSLALSSGYVSKDKPMSLHSCDEPLCVNPHHLRWGTHQENMDDKKARGRCAARRGETSNFAKLTSEQVLEIRELAGTMPQHKIADIYNISQVGVSDIVRRKNWKHI